MFHFQLKQLMLDLLKNKVGSAGESGGWATPYRINDCPAEHNAVSRGRLAGGAVGDLTSEGLREDGSGKGKRNAESNNNNNDGNRPGRYDSRGVVLQLPRSVSVQIFGLTRSNAVSSFLPRVNPAWALPLSLSE